MYQLFYEIETLSPVLLTQISGDANMVSTLDYIPGTVVQGIFANKFIKKENLHSDAHEDSTFNRWFLNAGLIFTNAYIADENDGQKAYFFPTPFSINKYKIAEPEDIKNKAFDLIIKDPDEKQKSHASLYCRIEISENTKDSKIFTKNVKKSINFHHARENRIRGHSEEGTIFNYESLDSGQIFVGRILGSETDLKEIKTLLENNGKIRIGRSKNTQYGEAKLTWISSEPEKYESEVQGFVPNELNSSFILTFLSPAIIYNNFGFASASINDLRRLLAKSLNLEALNLASENIVIKKSFKRTEIIENFVGKWMLKKPSENSIKAGSCFEIEIRVADDQFGKIKESLKESLLELQKAGIGERTGEGFGRFAIDLQKVNKYELNKPDEEETKSEQKGKVKKPAGEIPELTKGIIKNVILNSYYTRIEAKALGDCSDFLYRKERVPSNSLIGRMELMLRDSKSSKEFMKKIDSFPQLTRNKLERCRNEEKKETLFYFVVPKPNISTDKETAYINKEAEVFNNLSIDADLAKACDLINFYPEKNPDSKFEFYSHYWLTFLAKMRKEKKRVKSQGKGGKNNGNN